MFDVPAPAHGFFRVQVAWVLRIVATVVTVMGFRALGLPASAVGGALLLVAAVLLVPLWPLFRRLQPEGSEAKKPERA